MTSTLHALLRREQSRTNKATTTTTTTYIMTVQGRMLCSSDRLSCISLMSRTCLNRYRLIARACRIFDLYLSNEREVRRNLQVIVLTCCILSSKIDSNNHTSSEPTVRIGDFPKTIRPFLIAFEKKISIAIAYSFGTTCYEFVIELMSLLSSTEHSSVLNGGKIMRADVFYNCCLCYELLPFSVLVRAVAIVYYRLQVSGGDIDSFFISLQNQNQNMRQRHMQLEVGKCVLQLRQHLHVTTTPQKPSHSATNADSPDSVVCSFDTVEHGKGQNEQQQQQQRQKQQQCTIT
jgi:hypothetical protein